MHFFNSNFSEFGTLHHTSWIKLKGNTNLLKLLAYSRKKLTRVNLHACKAGVVVSPHAFFNVTNDDFEIHLKKIWCIQRGVGLIATVYVWVGSYERWSLKQPPNRKRAFRSFNKKSEWSLYTYKCMFVPYCVGDDELSANKHVARGRTPTGGCCFI